MRGNIVIAMVIATLFIASCAAVLPSEPRHVCVQPELLGPYVVSQEVNHAEIKSFVLSQRDWLELSRYLKCEKGTPENLSPTGA